MEVGDGETEEDPARGFAGEAAIRIRGAEGGDGEGDISGRVLLLRGDFEGFGGEDFGWMRNVWGNRIGSTEIEVFDWD